MDQMQSTQLWSYLEMVPDPRQRRGKRYEWTFLLAIICIGLACGQRTVWAIWQWARLHEAKILKALAPRYPHIPSAITLYRALQGVDVEALDKEVGAYSQSIASWLAAQETSEHWPGVAVDGKEIRGAAQHGPKVHLVSLVTHGSGLALAQRRVAEKAYEPDALCQMLEGQDLRGIVITMDALYTHADIAQRILDRGGHYFMMVKGNQPGLRDDIAYLFSQRPAPGEARWECTPSDKGHGRLEERHVVSSEALNGYLGWPQVGQVLQRTCTQTRPGKGVSQNTSWAITSLTHAQASVEELGLLWRAHWVIENRVHYVRDETLGEDRGQIAKGHAPHALASLRNALLSALRGRGWTSIAQALRFFAANINDSIQLSLEVLA